MDTPAPVAVKKFEFIPFLISVLTTLAVGMSASAFTRPQIAGWYQQLHKPGFTPPPWVFGPVWTVLYIMMAVAGYLIWKRRCTVPAYYCSKAYYFLQLTFNFLWSFTFFFLHETVLALVVILMLLVSIGGSMYYFRKIYKTAAWLMLPYLLWVGYATALNLSICMLNGW